MLHPRRPLLPLAILSFSLAATSDTALYCNLIDSRIPGTISYPESTSYDASLASYYSSQESDLHPSCIFSPKSTTQVSEFVKLVTSADACSGASTTPLWAIRSGGHTIWSGAANIRDGITVDLRAMNSLELKGDRTVASLGAGGTWSDIYPQLVEYNLTVMGGRVAGIGVGGISTGGGINYLSRREGWVCDNIFNYEVVLGNGSVINANAEENEDLWLALKGGSNNFGVVTRIDVPTWELGLMWQSIIIFPYTQEVLDAHAQAYSDFMKPENWDGAADMGVILIYQNGSYTLADTLFYADAVENPPVYQRFTSIPGQVLNNTMLSDVGTIVKATGGTLPNDTRRAIDIVYSFRNGDAELYSELFHTWRDGAETIASIPGLNLDLLIQPHPVSNGTNSLGLPAGEKELVLSVITAAYASASDDEIVFNAMQAIVAKHEAITKERGLWIPFKYLNYADKSQDPIGSYGPDIVQRLRVVSRKYDPHAVFQAKVPGGFKLFPVV